MAASSQAPAARAGVSRRLWIRHGLPLLIYTGAALLLTWPLAAHLLTHVPGDGIDDPSLAWNLWWASERLVQQGSLDLFNVGWMFHPVAINLAFYTLTPLQGLLSLPLHHTVGLTLAANLLILSSFVLGGYGMYLLALDTLAPLTETSTAQRARALWVAALLAGGLYAFAAPKLFYIALGQFNIAGSQWIPFAVLYSMRLLRAATPSAALRAGVMAGFFLILQAWTELTYASFLLLFVALVAVAGVIPAMRRGRWQGSAGGLLAAGALFVVGISPILAAMLPDLRAEGDFFASGGGFADQFSADLAGFLVPTRLHPLAGDLAAALPFANDKGQQIWLGYTALLLALLGIGWLWRRSRGQAIFWTVATAGFWLLSLGPSLRWMGRDLGIPGPFALVSLLPFFNGNRYPSRYSVMLLLCIALLAAAGVMALIAWLQRCSVQRAPAWAGGVVAALLLIEHLSLPLPMSDMRVPPIYARLAAEPGDLAVLELPTGWRNGARVLGYSDLLIMRQQWWQSEHGKRRLGGNTSRNPAHKFQYYTDHPLLGDLIALMNADRPHLQPVVQARLDELIATHAPQAAQELADLGVGFVTVHVEHASPELLRFVDEALPLALLEEWSGLDAEGMAATIRLYRVMNDAEVDVSNAQHTVDPAAERGSAFLAEGWSAFSAGTTRIATRAVSHLLLALPERGGSLMLASNTMPARVRINGRALAGDWDGTQITVPFAAGYADEPVDRVTIEWQSNGVDVTEMADRAEPIGETGTNLPSGAALAVRSAGEEVGDFANLWVNGVVVAAVLPQRGYLLAALQPGGALLDTAAFDTHADPSASAALADWIARWPQGTIVAGAVADEASLLLGAEAVSALASLGVEGDLRDRFRWSHAFVGVVGAHAGSALEQFDLLRPAGVWVGPALTGARGFGAIGEIRWHGQGRVAQSNTTAWVQSR